MLRREDDAPLLGGRDAGRGAAETPVGTHPYLDEDERAVALAHDEIDLAGTCAGPARDPIIALHERQALLLQMPQRTEFAFLARRPGRPAA